VCQWSFCFIRFFSDEDVDSGRREMSLFARLSAISRRRKFELFSELMWPQPTTTVLDVGGEVNPQHDRTLRFIDSYPWKSMLSAINVSADHVSLIKRRYPEVDARVADACNLPWPDKHFDIVFCNAVIEHVGDFGRQRRMAQEIMRVGKAWFVTTPNRWFPYEFHLRLPLVTWLPFHGYRWVGALFGYNHVRRKYSFTLKPRRVGLRLLSRRELMRCFPGSRIFNVRVTFWPETLVAAGGTAEQGQGRSTK
jgi:hypothetical protein